MKNTHRISVRALVIKDESVLLVRHEHRDRPPFWCFPGGLVEPGEDLFTAIKREIREETYLEVFPKSVVALQEFKRESLLEVIFSCDYVSGRTNLGSDPDNSGVPTLVEVKWVEIGEIEKYRVLPIWLSSRLKTEWNSLSSIQLYEVASKHQLKTGSPDSSVL
ncbi:ADP-ribose pyrophosphatase [Mesotoga sp. SC_NapDC2]|jgi:ADP-ribose pyrophosphatase YjhB (NUDIX family)|uniref:NUDIX domain-containing protein n=1 Tax=unclassified Mesotoga TaxID=1184398 RepID=UPI000CC62F15|nr:MULTISPECIES: NUDIX domain-containing protein [unclassified Mesotoga]MDD3460188.1 NUDIX domain-containing protein [Mesotoga sp.]PNQ05145.1 ADP-ribose pyrophosphatase [Mesotoga sp. SC_NapDC3]PXF34174.1 ADP-ribose pyrophosphatase [Mesotoga sp. SC_NapDC]RIZ61073.1 ADP-ribose pyrophosphatase [Mesotoga sp. SC_NapDC2]